MPRLYLLLFIFCVTASIANCGNGNQQVFKLDLSPLKGKVYTYSFYHVITSQFLQQSRSDTITMEINMEVESSQDPLGILRFTFQDLHKSELPPAIQVARRGFPKRRIQELKSELASKTDAIFHALKGKHVKVIVSGKGVVEKIEGAEELLSQIASDCKEDKRLVGQVIHDYASENAITDHINLLFSAVPNMKVIPGENWGKDITLVTKAPININSFYTFKELKGDTAYLDIQSKILGGTAGNFYLKGTRSGFAIINYGSGLPYLVETRASSTTTTTEYEVRQEEHWIIMLKRTDEKLLTFKHR